MWKDSIMVNFRKSGNIYSGVTIASFTTHDVNKTIGIQVIILFKYIKRRKK